MTESWKGHPPPCLPEHEIYTGPGVLVGVMAPGGLDVPGQVGGHQGPGGGVRRISIGIRGKNQYY